MSARSRASVIGATSACSLLLMLASTTTLHAQDVEARSWVSGRPLPAAYFDRVREDPSFFELSDGWIARAGTASLTASDPTSPDPDTCRGLRARYG